MHSFAFVPRPFLVLELIYDLSLVVLWHGIVKVLE